MTEEMKLSKTKTWKIRYRRPSILKFKEFAVLLETTEQAGYTVRFCV